MDDIYFDDILFDSSSSQEDLELYTNLSDESECDLLFADSDDEPTLWDTEEVPVQASIDDTSCASVDIVHGNLMLRSTHATDASDQPLLHDR